MGQTGNVVVKETTPTSASTESSGKPGSGSEGFTLLELLLVLSIIGLASALIIPNMGNLESRTFSAQVRQASALLNYARRIAVVQGQPSVASFYAFVEEEDYSEPVPASSAGVWESNGAAIRYRDSADREVEIEEKIDITFYPEGGSTGGTLLMSLDEQRVRIVVDPFTGRVSTEWADDEQFF